MMLTRFLDAFQFALEPINLIYCAVRMHLGNCSWGVARAWASGSLRDVITFNAFFACRTGNHHAGGYPLWGTIWWEYHRPYS